MKRLLAFSSLLALAACGGSQSLADRSRDALPSKDTVAVGTPGAKASAARGPFSVESQDSKVGDGSVWALTTAALATVVNGSVVWTLALVERVVEFPPSACTANSCTWGPFSGALDPVRWKLVVSHDESTDTYSWSLSGERKAGPAGFTTVVQGTAKPSGLPHRGSGHFTVDFDAGRLLDPASNDIGTLDVTYSNATPGAASLDVTFLGVKDDDHAGQKLNIVYGFREQQLGGDLEIAWRNLTSNDRLSLHSRWQGTGAGRSDLAVQVTGGTGNYQASASECWRGGDFKVVYFTTNDPAHLGAPDGTESSCAFTPAAPATKQAP